LRRAWMKERMARARKMRQRRRWRNMERILRWATSGGVVVDWRVFEELHGIADEGEEATRTAGVHGVHAGGGDMGEGAEESEGEADPGG